MTHEFYSLVDISMSYFLSSIFYSLFTSYCECTQLLHTPISCSDCVQVPLNPPMNWSLFHIIPAQTYFTWIQSSWSKTNSILAWTYRTLSHIHSLANLKTICLPISSVCNIKVLIKARLSCLIFNLLYFHPSSLLINLNSLLILWKGWEM
jgi:hypothetical protein